MTKKTMLITGSSRGIGAAIAQLAHTQGFDVILHGRRKTPTLEALATELDARVVTFDVSDETAVNAGIESLGNIRIDALVNCAGVVIPGNTLESEYKNWMDTYTINVMGAVNVVKAVAPIMTKHRQGKIVNVSSIHGHDHIASEGVIAYSASKAALLNLTVSWAREFAPYINVNAISPGFTLTDMSETWPDHVQKQATSNLRGRVATTTDIANAVLFFAGDQSDFITGQSLIVDGGYTVANRGGESL